MRSLLPIVATYLFVTGSALASPSLPSRKAFDTAQQQRGVACMKSLTWSHAAYVPARREAALGCSHLLSTDTLVSVHRWDKT